jgi:hypothetical protein
MRLPLAFAASLAAGTVIVAEEPARGPDPIEITLAAAEFIAGLESVSFRWFLSHDEIVDGREKLTYFQSGTSTMARGIGFVVRTERDDTYRDYYSNGETFTIASPHENFYASTPFKGSFEALVESVRQVNDAVMPTWSTMSRDLPDRLVEGAGDAAYFGVNLIDGQLAHQVAFAVSDENWQVWISTDPEVPVPIMIIITDRGMQGWPQSRIHFADGTFPVDPDLSQFTFASDADADADDVLLQIPKPRPAAGLPQAWEPGAEEQEVQPSGSPVRERLLLFLATVSIIAGPKPFPFLTRP